MERNLRVGHLFLGSLLTGHGLHQVNIGKRVQVNCGKCNLGVELVVTGLFLRVGRIFLGMLLVGSQRQGVNIGERVRLNFRLGKLILGLLQVGNKRQGIGLGERCNLGVELVGTGCPVASIQFEGLGG